MLWRNPFARLPVRSARGKRKPTAVSHVAPLPATSTGPHQPRQPEAADDAFDPRQTLGHVSTRRATIARYPQVARATLQLNLAWMEHTWTGRKSGFVAVSLPLFHAGRRRFDLG